MMRSSLAVIVMNSSLFLYFAWPARVLHERPMYDRALLHIDQKIPKYIFFFLW
jgi:hypothetical protein